MYTGDDNVSEWQFVRSGEHHARRGLRHPVPLQDNPTKWSASHRQRRNHLHSPAGERQAQHTLEHTEQVGWRLRWQWFKWLQMAKGFRGYQCDSPRSLGQRGADHLSDQPQRRLQFVESHVFPHDIRRRKSHQLFEFLEEIVSPTFVHLLRWLHGRRCHQRRMGISIDLFYLIVWEIQFKYRKSR